LVAAALGLAMLLLVARVLQPDKSGYGTHRHLGLPPCTFMFLFHRPCPTCGMTTAWAWLMRGRVLESLRANACGTLLAVWSLLAIPWLLATAAAGRRLRGTPRAPVVLTIVIALITLAMLQWGWRLWAG
jgi:hypothetical protein